MTYIFAQSNTITNKLWTKRNTSANHCILRRISSQNKAQHLFSTGITNTWGNKRQRQSLFTVSWQLTVTILLRLNVQLWPQVPIARLTDISFDSWYDQSMNFKSCLPSDIKSKLEQYFDLNKRHIDEIIIGFNTLHDYSQCSKLPYGWRSEQ